MSQREPTMTLGLPTGYTEPARCAAAMAGLSSLLLGVLLCCSLSLLPLITRADEPTAEPTAPAQAAAAVQPFREAFELQREHKMEEAIAKYREGLAADPFNATAHLFLGEAYATVNNLAYARRELDVALSLDLAEKFAERARADLAALPPLAPAIAALLASIETSMVAVPGGTFQMGGAPQSEVAEELPRHAVTVRSMHLAKDPVTFEQFDAYAHEVGKPLPDDRGWGRGRRPVINISWDAAKAFIVWLNKQSAVTYRLPTEAEWEFAARGANLGEALPASTPADVADDEDEEHTIPVDEAVANALGVRNMIGGPMEWVQDCYHDDYTGAPDDGSAWLEGDCGRRVERGGLARRDADNRRPSVRHWHMSNFRFGVRGFRLARED